MEPVLVAGQRLAIVTGTSAGIGAACVAALLREGWSVLGAARREVCFDDPRYMHRCVDLGATPELAAFASEHISTHLAAQPWQRVALVNNAARLGMLRRLETMTPTEIAEVLAINSVAPMYLMGFVARAVPAATPLRVVNISSGAAVMGLPGLADYCASKAALRLAGMSLAAEFAEQKRDAAVFSYEPGMVATDMQEAARATDTAAFPSRPAFVAAVETGKLATPEAVVGEVVAYLEQDGVEAFTESRYGRS